MLKLFALSVAATILVLFFALETGAGAAANPRTLSLKLSPDESRQIALAGFSGELNFTRSAGESAEITVTIFPAEKGLGIQAKIAAFRLEKIQGENGTSVTLVPFPGIEDGAYKISASAALPEGAGLAVEIPEGSVKMRGVKLGKAAVRVSGGRIDISSCAFVALSAYASAGISARSSKGALNLSADGGDIYLQNHAGAVSANTGEGAIKIEGGLGNRSVASDSGSVFISAASPSTREEREQHFYDAIQVNTFSGNVKLELPAGDYSISAISKTGIVRWRIAKGLGVKKTGKMTVVGEGHMAVAVETESGGVDIAAGYS